MLRLVQLQSQWMLDVNYLKLYKGKDSALDLMRGLHSKFKEMSLSFDDTALNKESFASMLSLNEHFSAIIKEL